MVREDVVRESNGHVRGQGDFALPANGRASGERGKRAKPEWRRRQGVGRKACEHVWNMRPPAA